MGQVLQAGAGQAPARQAAVGAGIPIDVPSDTVNKVCASSIRAVEIADSMIRAGDVEVVVTGGMESMTNAPYALPKARKGYRMGDGTLRRPHDLGRAALDVRRAAHGAAGGEGRPRARRLARGPGRLGAPLARAGRGRAGRRPLRRRDRSRGRGDGGRVGAARHHARQARLPEAGDGSRGDGHGRQRARRQRRRLVRRRVLGGVRATARARAARDDRLAGLRRGRVRVARAHAGERR